MITIHITVVIPTLIFATLSLLAILRLAGGSSKACPVDALVRLTTRAQDASARGMEVATKFKDVIGAFGITRTKALHKAIDGTKAGKSSRYIKAFMEPMIFEVAWDGKVVL